MVTFLLTLILLGAIVVTGTIVNVHLYDTDHLGRRFRRSRRFKSITRRPMTDAEYFKSLDKVDEENSRYARNLVLILLFLAMLGLIVVVSLISGFP